MYSIYGVLDCTVYSKISNNREQQKPAVLAVKTKEALFTNKCPLFCWFTLSYEIWGQINY